MVVKLQLPAWFCAHMYGLYALSYCPWSMHVSFPVFSQALPCLQSRCNFPAPPSSPKKHCMVLQELGVTVPQLALPPQKWLRTLAPALCTLQYHLCLASTAVLPTHQAAASLTSLVLLPWVRTLHRLLPRHVLAVCIESKSVHCKCRLFQFKAFLNYHKMHALCGYSASDVCCTCVLCSTSLFSLAVAMCLWYSIFCCTLHADSTPIRKSNLAC